MKDKKASAYLASEKPESFQRPSENNIIGYINEFDQVIQRHEMTLPTKVLVYRLLKNMNLSNEKQQ